MVGTYELINYFDVWGNEVDGYIVNDAMVSGNVEFPENATDAEIILSLKDFGILGEYANENTISIEGDDMFMELKNKDNDYPICQLRRTS